MESPLAASQQKGQTADAAGSRAEMAARPGTIEDSLTVETRRLHGYAFPGVDAAVSPADTAAPTLTAPPPREDGQRVVVLEQRLNELEEQLRLGPEALEQRVQEMETKLAAVEGRPAEQVSGRPEELLQRYESLSEKLAAVEARQQELDTQAPATLRDQMQAMESRLAELENRAPRDLPAQQGNVEEAYNQLSARLAVLETAPAPQTDQVPEAVREQIQAMETRMANLENRPPQQIETRPENLERRFDEMSEKLAKLESSGAAGGPEHLRDQMQRMEARLAELEQRPAQSVEVPADQVEQRFEELRKKLATFENEQLQQESAAAATLRDQIAEMEQRVAQLEQQPAPAPASGGPSQDLEARFNELSGKLAALEQQSAAAPADARYAQLQAQVEALEQTVSAQTSPEPSGAAPSAPMPSVMLDGNVSDALPAAYQIGAGDQLEFICFNDEALNRDEIKVRYDGYISLPLIREEIKVGGLSREEAEIKVEQAYARVFRKPLISLMVRSALSKYFTVMGDIQEPGQFPYEQPIRLIDAISQAGGLRDRASSGGSNGGFVGITGQLVKAFVIRRVSSERQVFEYDLRKINVPGQHGSEAPVFPGDIIYVPEGVNLVYVLGEAGNQVVELIDGMTMLQLLSLAGGFDSSTARLNQVVLMREVDKDHSEVMLVNLRNILHDPNLDIVLNPGDIVYVPRKRMVQIEEFIARFTGSVSPVLNLYNQYIDAKYQERISQQLLKDDSGVLQTITAIGNTSQALIDVIGTP